MRRLFRLKVSLRTPRPTSAGRERAALENALALGPLGLVLKEKPSPKRPLFKGHLSGRSVIPVLLHPLLIFFGP
jgi:hypothetical protein